MLDSAAVNHATRIGENDRFHVNSLDTQRQASARLRTRVLKRNIETSSSLTAAQLSTHIWALKASRTHLRYNDDFTTINGDNDFHHFLFFSLHTFYYIIPCAVSPARARVICGDVISFALYMYMRSCVFSGVFANADALIFVWKFAW